MKALKTTAPGARWAVTVLALVVVILSATELRSYQHESCRRGIAERVNTTHESEAAIAAFHIVATTAKQPAWRAEFGALERQGRKNLQRRRRRLDPAHGGKLVCPTGSLTAVLP